MRLTIEQEILSSNLSLISRAIPSRPNHPILSNILFEASEEMQQLSLTAFDLSLGIRTCMKAQIEQGGTFTLPAKLLNDIVSRLPGTSITLDLDAGDAIATLTCQSGRYQVRGMEAEEYPALPLVETAESIQLSAEALMEGLKGTLFSTSPDETKQVLTGVHLKLDSGHLEFASTDGHRLAVVKTENTQTSEATESVETSIDEFEVTIPAKALREVERMWGTKGSQKEDGLSLITLRFDPAQVIFELGNQRLTTRKLEGGYPAYQQLIPNKFASQINIDRKQFLGALERIAVLASQKNDIVKCTIDSVNQEIALSVEATDVGNAVERLSAQISGDEPQDLAFNVKYLLEGLKVFNTQEVQLQLNQATSPVILTPLGGFKMTYLVMPVQIRG
ncbi:MAG: DNA polymerase III subunit beta [Microcoleaceae cyanobacterium]